MPDNQDINLPGHASTGYIELFSTLNLVVEIQPLAFFTFLPRRVNSPNAPPALIGFGKFKGVSGFIYVRDYPGLAGFRKPRIGFVGV